MSTGERDPQTRERRVAGLGDRRGPHSHHPTARLRPAPSVLGRSLGPGGRWAPRRFFLMFFYEF